MVIDKFNRLIRNKWVWGVFAIAISVFFAFDFLFTGRDDEGRSSGSAGVLDGQDVSAATFRDLVDDVRGFGRQRDNARTSAEVNREAWQTAAALAVAKRLKMTATDNEVREAIRRDPSFQAEKGGGFNYQMYAMLLRENGFTEERFEAFLKRRLTLQKLSQVVLGSAAWVSPAELEGAINDVTDNFTVRVATFQHKDAASVKLDDAGLEAYYKDNTNSVALPDLVTVKYVKFQADAPARLAQFKITDDEMHDHYDATSSRFETTVKGTNGVETTVTKKFEEVKPQLEKELQLIASLEAYRTNLLFRVYPQNAKPDDKSDRLVKIAGEEKAEVKTSPLFSMDGGKFVKGFMTRPATIAPGCSGFAAAVAELDPDSEDLRYGVVAGTNAVYLIERASFVKAHVPTFAEAKEHIRADALADARAKAFKAQVEKTRALVAAELAKGKPLDAKMFGDANVTTSMTFSVSSIGYGAFPNSTYVAPATMKLSKGQLSDFVKTALPTQGLLVYVEKREPGDAAQAQMVRAQLRDELSRYAGMALASNWNKWNLDRMGFTSSSSVSSVEEADDEGAVPEE